MKVAITCRADSMDALIDQRFGRCSWFAVYDTVNQNVKFIKNTAKDEESGAGPAAVAIVAEAQVGKVVSGEFGFKIKQMLMELNIQMVMLKEDKTVAQIIGLIAK